jgi:hypothetical protein
MALVLAIQLAPELNGGDWVNATHRLKLEELRGKVVLLHFWTYG